MQPRESNLSPEIAEAMNSVGQSAARLEDTSDALIVKVEATKQQIAETTEALRPWIMPITIALGVLALSFAVSRIRAH